MSSISVCGCGAVSPAGWGLGPLREALAHGKPLAVQALARPGWERPLNVRLVPQPTPRPTFSSHARLRRTSPIAQFAVASALEALGEDARKVSDGSLALGIVLCVMSGCVNYSRRFYDEALKDPATASPLVFPETVFNAPASHLAALLGTTAINYTLVGDPGTFLQGLALAADWLLAGRVEGCLVIGAEEMDWLTTDAYRLFDRNVVVSDGAGALYLRRKFGQYPAIELETVTDPWPFSRPGTRLLAAQAARQQLGRNGAGELLCDGLEGMPRWDEGERLAWADWTGPRLSPKRVLGEGRAAAAAWQCVAAIDALKNGHAPAAIVSVLGSNQQAIAARFVARSSAPTSSS